MLFAIIINFEIVYKYCKFSSGIGIRALNQFQSVMEN
jgi:hypothetical protein